MKFTAVLCIASATVATAVLVGAAASHADVLSREGTIARFAGFPPIGIKASTPTTGRLVLGLRTEDATGVTEWDVYLDGRVIRQKWTPSGDATIVPKGARRLDTGYVQQRLSFYGVQLLWSKLLATGLFEHDLWLAVGKGHAGAFHRVRRGDLMVKVVGVASPDPSWNEPFTNATAAETRALAWIAALVAHPARSLPTTVWADRRIRPFVPARYVVAFDRSYPDSSKLPRPVGEVLSRYKVLKRDACQIVTTGRARALLQAFAAAGIAPSENHASYIAFDFRGLGLPRPSELHLFPALPDVGNTSGPC
jgi:hypothetical protein